MDNKATLILGSSSPFRRELLERLQIPFTTCSPDVDETPLKGESPKDLSLRLSVLKAQAVAAQHPHCVVEDEADEIKDDLRNSFENLKKFYEKMAAQESAVLVSIY